MARGGPFPVSDPRWCKVTASGTESGFYAYDRENASTVAALAADLEAVEPPRTFVFGADRGTVHVECQHGFVSVVGGVPKEPACVDPGCVEDACGWWEREKHWLDRETPVVSDGTAASYASVLLDSLPPPLPPPADTPGAASSRARGPSAASGGSLGAMPPAGRSQVRLCPPHVSLPPPEHQCEWREAVCGHCPRTWRTCAPDNNPSKGCGAEWGCGTDHVCTPEWSGSARASSTGDARLSSPCLTLLLSPASQATSCGGCAPAVVDAEPLTPSEPGFRIAAPEPPHKGPLAVLSTGAAQGTAVRRRPAPRRPSRCPPPVGIAA